MNKRLQSMGSELQMATKAVESARETKTLISQNDIIKPRRSVFLAQIYKLLLAFLTFSGVFQFLERTP